MPFAFARQETPVKHGFFLRVRLLGSAVCAFAQHPSADEEAMRKVMTASNAGRPAPRTPDTVFWSGLYMKPYVRGEQPHARLGSSVVGTNRTHPTTTVKVLPLGVTASGAMVYAYSTFPLAGEHEENGRHGELAGGVGRV